MSEDDALERLVPRRPAAEPGPVERQGLPRERRLRRVRQPGPPRGSAVTHPRDRDVRAEPAAVGLVPDGVDQRRDEPLLQPR